MHALDLTIVVAFVVYAVGSGLRSRKAASTSLSEYFLAGRSLGGTAAGLSMAATQFAADTPLLVTGLIATTGIFGLWRLWIYACAFLLLGYVLAPSWRRAGVLTDAELSETRYAGPGAVVLRGVKAVYFGLGFNCTVLAMVLFAAARIAEPFLWWHAWLPASLFEPVLAAVKAVGVPLGSGTGSTLWRHTADNVLSLGAILLITTFYSTTGGLRSVVRTDLLQLALSLGGTAVYAYYAVMEVGGLSALSTRLQGALANHPDGLTVGELLAFTPGEAHAVGGSMLAVLALQWLIQINSDGTGYLAQRCMACRSDRDATRAAVVFAWTQIVLRSLLWLPIGLAMLVLFEPSSGAGSTDFVASREGTYVRGMVELLPVGVRGLLLTAMLAALASTLDTHLNWGASYLTNDLYDRLYCRAFRRRAPSPARLVTVARLGNGLIVLLALLIMTQLSSIQDAWKVSLLLGSGMGVMLILRWLWWRITALGELACLLTASIASPLLLTWISDEQEALRLLILALVATAAGIATSLLRPEPKQAGAIAFYRRARPPGFWAPMAAASGEPSSAPTRRLAKALQKTLLATLALFCALLGLGSLLVEGTVPAWFPVPWLWEAALLSACLALTYRQLTIRDSPP
ncbi:MAG: hypothetical protein OXU20_03195 [Myxococcales bacterium]|nr:hypothetical protein [Myxococcales bacterium]